MWYRSVAAPSGLPPLPRIGEQARDALPTIASQGRAMTGWFLSLLVRGLTAPPELHMHKQTK